MHVNVSDVILVFLLLTLTYSIPFSSVSIIGFGQVNVTWVFRKPIVLWAGKVIQKKSLLIYIIPLYSFFYTHGNIRKLEVFMMYRKRPLGWNELMCSDWANSDCNKSNNNEWNRIREQISVNEHCSLSVNSTASWRF